MKTVPIIDTAAQSLRVQLGDQSCRIELRQKSTGFYLDLFVNEAPIIQGVICRNRTRVVRSAHFGFVGDLTMVDMVANEDPTSPGLGTRWLLCYLEPADLNGGA